MNTEKEVRKQFLVYWEKENSVSIVPRKKIIEDKDACVTTGAVYLVKWNRGRYEVRIAGCG